MRILLLILLTSQLSYSQIQDDKIKHFVGGVFISGVTNMIVYNQTHNRKLAFWSGLTAGILAGIGKELVDERKYKGWDNKDLACTISGAILTNVPLYLWEKKHVKRYNKRLEALKIK